MSPKELVCTSCGGDPQPLSAFHRDSKSRYGVRRDCKTCVNERRREAHAKTRELDRLRSRAWREDHPGYQSRKTKEWREANLVRDKARKKEWYEANPDYSARKAKEWRESNPEKHAAKQSARRALQRNQFVEKVDHLVVFERDGWTCRHCDLELSRDTKVPDPKAPTLDHIVPLTKGGEHSYSNVQLLCFRCNNKKGNRFTG